MSSRCYVRREVAPMRPIRLAPDQLWESLEEAYAAVRETSPAERGFGAAWKLGGTTAATRDTFRVDEAYFGPLHGSQVVSLPGSVPGTPLCELKAEVEVAVRIGPGGEELDAWCVAVEMPASPIEDLVERGVTALVADRCAAGCLVLGAPRPLGELPGDAAIVLRVDGSPRSEGALHTLLGTPLEHARHFLTLARSHGFAPAAGQWIATGGLTPCAPLARGARVEVSWDGAVAMAFELGAPA